MNTSNGSSDNIYLNVTVSNTTADPLAFTPAVYNVTYDNPILDKPSDYYMTIVKFEIPLQDLPLFVMPNIPATIYEGEASQAGNTVTGVGSTFFNSSMVGGTIRFVSGITETITGFTSPTVITVSGAFTFPNQIFTVTYGNTDPNLTPLQVGVCQQQDQGGIADPNAVNFPISVEYFSQVEDLTPLDPTYYYVYAYGHLMDMLNIALKASWVAAGSPGGAGNFPYYFWDETDSLIKIIMPWSFVHAAAVAGFHWTVFNNVTAQLFLFSFNGVQINGRLEVWEPPAEYDNSYIAQAPFPVVANNTRGAGLTYIFPQEYGSTDYMNSVRKIVITTTAIPVQKEFFPQPGNTNLSNANTIGIITDFYLDLSSKAGAQRSVAIYTADLYRLIDLISDNPLRKIDLYFFWADRLNNLYPLTLSVYDSISLKMGFFSKKLYRNPQLKYI